MTKPCCLMSNRMKHIMLTMLATVWSMLATAQESINQCEYWLDHDFDSRTPIAVTDGGWVEQIDVGALKPGLHVMGIRMGTSDGRWSPVLTKYFLVPPATPVVGNTLQTYEYWVDHQYDQKVSGSVAPGGIIDLNLDFSTLPAGLHNVAFRVFDNDGQSSGLLVKYFMVVPATPVVGSTLQSYEYWVDHQYDQKISGSIAAGGIIDLNLDFSMLPAGLHNVAFRVMDDNGQSSSILVKYFLVPSAAPITGRTLQSYELWFDDGFDQRISGEVPANGVIDINVNLATFATLSAGDHILHYRVTDNMGQTSAVASHAVKIFLKGDANSDGSVTIIDAVSVVNNILGNPVENFDFEAADVNEDKAITITDAVGVVNIIVGSGAAQ